MTRPIDRRTLPQARAGRSLAALVLAGGLLAGCATFPETSPSPDAAVPAEAPRTVGLPRQPTPEHARLVSLFGGQYQWPAVEDQLNKVLAKLAATSQLPDRVYKVTLLNSPVVNAFALPNGNLYLTRGLLALASDMSEVAAVMAHEIAHVSTRHAAQRAELERRSQLVGRVVSRLLEKPADGERVEAKAKLTLASFSRQQELEADRIGVRNIADAGYDPFGAARFLGALGRSSSLRAAAMGGGSSTERPDILATHPSTPERVNLAIAAARQIGAPGLVDAGREDYLNAINSIVYGDDPSQGFVRGRRFLHPTLGFAFTAPDGFVLENSAQALLGIAGGGNAAVRLDSVRVPAATTLEAYLASGWIEGLDAGSVQTIEVNGLPAATAIAKGDEWTFRLAAIRFGTDVYRMIFATRSLTPETDARFKEAIQSFRRLSKEEAAGARPMRIALVTAKPGDTPDSIAQTMAGSERPLDLFLLLNGIERTAALQPGQRYKVVVE